MAIADFYNNRIVLNRGEGWKSKMNASTGIYVSDEEIMITDFENDRVLIYDHEGALIQIIDKGLNKPTDLFVSGDQLFITNYKGRYISLYKKG